ncbi:MAG TPA: hypothetical protein VK427_04660 [Kofleriaceae bacterium]|nr:hypothetical protein [Kofleriaceae bacterium]
MRAVVLCCAVAGCFRPSPDPGAPCAANGDCPDGLSCSADQRCVEAASDGLDACGDAVCVGDELVGCGSAVTCEYGCAEGASIRAVPAGARCRALVPSNGISPALLAGATADVTMVDLDFDTDDGAITLNGTMVRPAGEGVIGGIRFALVDGLAVWAARSWTSSGASSEDWKARGANPIVLYAATTITVSGLVDVGAQGMTGGPGGVSGNPSVTPSGCRGRAGRSNATVGSAFGEGGGGGGGLHDGGDGGPSTIANPTGVGGTTCAAPSAIPLRGGSSGGHGGQDVGNAGGGGGGAIMLVAMDAVTITGIVASPGAGGMSATTGSGGGGGGGSGGAILVEAPRVNIAGSLSANGGAGAAPAGGTDGGRGSLSSTTAAGGGGFSCVATAGGTAVIRRGGGGGTGTVAPTNGATCTVTGAAGTTSSQGGGGGGAAGRIVIRTLDGGITGVASPAATIEPAIVE